MTDLARQRRARDIWVSRSHLYALGTGMVLFAVACFALGYTAGRRSVDHFEPNARARLLDQPADDALVELLARVDAAATPDGGVRKLTFPDALAGQGTALEVPAQPVVEQRVQVPPAEAAPLEAGDEPPKGRWTIAVSSFAERSLAVAARDALQAREVEAWLGTERRDGAVRYRVAVGGFGSRAEAEDALDDLTLEGEVVRY